MSGESALRQYLRTVETEWEQIRDVMQVLRGEKKECKGPPKNRSEALQTLFLQAGAEASEAGLFDRVMPLIGDLQVRHEETIDLAWSYYEKGICRQVPDDPLSSTWNAAKESWVHLDRLVLIVEATIQDGKASKAHLEHAETLTLKHITFDDENRVITINGIPCPPIGNLRAYKLFKLVAQADGEIVSRQRIKSAISGLGGKNTIANTRKKLPKALQHCLNPNIGREGGYSYRPPRK